MGSGKVGTKSVDIKEWMGGVKVSTEGHKRMMVVDHGWWRVQAVGGAEQGWSVQRSRRRTRWPARDALLAEVLNDGRGCLKESGRARELV